MRVTGYYHFPRKANLLDIKPEEWVPSIPPGLITAEGAVWREEESACLQIPLSGPVDVPDGCWLGFEMNGSRVVIPAHEETEWRITRATQAIQSLMSRKDSSSALRAVYSLHAGAALLGIKISDLHSSLAQVRKSPEEPLETTVRALAAELARHK